MRTVTTVAELRAMVREATEARASVGFVPTMGALHAGHLRLIERAASEHELVVVSVFVNPTQFNDPADFAAYPRSLGDDESAAARSGAGLMFAPAQHEIYPVPPVVTVDPGPLGALLEGASRPGHFAGVVTVVTKLLSIVTPTSAYFGEKDYQQLLLVRDLVRDLSLGVQIVGCETVREPDGLALSSRNARLTPAARRRAPRLHGALLRGREALRAGASDELVEAEMREEIAKDEGIELDYARCLDAATLEVTSDPLRARRLLIAAFLDGVRLIDNIAG
jgi:pantoate--beta-alanine ligase